MDYIVQYNKCGLRCEGSEDIASEWIENLHFRPPRSHLTLSLQRTPANIPIKLTLLETRIPGLNFCHWQYESIFMQILVVGSETRVKCKRVHNCRPRSFQGQPWSFVDFGNNRKRIFDFLLVIYSNLCHISHRFGDTAAYWSKIANSYAPHPHSTPSLGVTPFEFWDERDILQNYNDGATIRWRNHDRRSNHVDTVH